MRDQYEKARRILESPANYPGLPERRRAHVSMRLWRYPSFEPYSSWAIIEESEQMFLRRVTWNQRVNPGVGPDTFGSEVPIALFQLEPLLAQAGFQEFGTLSLLVLSDQGINDDCLGNCWCFSWGSFLEGRKYLVFAEETAEKDLVVRSYSQTSPLDKASEDLKELQKMSSPFYRFRVKP